MQKEIQVSYFRGYADAMPTEKPLDQVVELIRNGATVRDHTEKYRYFNAQGHPRAAGSIKGDTPCFAVAVRFRPGGKDKGHIAGFTGLSLVDFDHIPAERLEEVLQLVHEDPHTLLAYTTISGKGLRIIFPIEGMTEEVAECQKRYRQAFLYGNRYYARLTGLEFDEKCKNSTRLSGLAHDAGAFYRPDAQPFSIGEMLEDEEFRMKNEKKSSPGRKVSPTLLSAIYKELEAQGVAYVEHRHNEFIMRCGYLLNAYGVSLEAATAWAVKKFADYDGDVAGILRSCYQQTDEHGTRAVPTKKRRKEKRPIFATVAEIEAFLTGQAEFRHNVITGKVEFNEKLIMKNEELPAGDDCGAQDSSLLVLHSSFKELDERFVNSLWSRMCKQSEKAVRINDLRTVLNSEFVPLYNPFEVYLSGLPVWDGTTDYIGQLADSVVLRDEQERPFFSKYFKKWLVNMVASMLEPEIVNHEILVFIGPQGSYKTSWMRHLLPPELRRYFYVKTDSGRITKDDLFSLTEFALICLEELEALQGAETNQLKALVSKPEVNERAAYGHYKERRPHLASFCGTTNNVQFLTDLTGNRRWLPIEVGQLRSPFDHPLDYTGIYSQAHALSRSGFGYFLSPEENREVNLHNLHYEVPCMEQELIQMLFRVPPPRQKEGTIFLSTAYIMHRLNGWLRQPLSTAKVGVAMTKAGFTPRREGGVRGYRVIELDGDRIRENAISVARFMAEPE